MLSRQRRERRQIEEEPATWTERAIEFIERGGFDLHTRVGEHIEGDCHVEGFIGERYR